MWDRKYKSELPVKECAYCKSRNLEIRYDGLGKLFYHVYIVECLSCGAQGKITGCEDRLERVLLEFGFEKQFKDNPEEFKSVEWK